MNVSLAASLMEEFADSTGVRNGAVPRRYLWTDAFAVCNFLGLFREAGDSKYLDLSVELVRQVHHVLGRHRPDDVRRGWISGLSEEEGELHPTCGGLRIGKRLNERGPHEPADSRLEWDQDGQYFHYLTKWIHALQCMSRQTEDGTYLQWAVELAIAAHQGFTVRTAPGRPMRMVWKMSIDLSRPLVASVGHHDPLDGLVRCLSLQVDQQRLGELSSGYAAGLERATADLREMCREAKWATSDALGVGGLLMDAGCLAKLVIEQHLPQRELLKRLLLDADLSLRHIRRSLMLSERPDRRLAFRELGLSIGFHAIMLAHTLLQQDAELSGLLDLVLSYQFLAEEIESFWADSTHRENSTWKEHQDINTVMLATSLLPAGYLSA